MLAYLVYVAFALGNLLFTLMLANNAVQQNKRFNSWGRYFGFYWVALIIRSSIEIVLFSLLLAYPQALPSLFSIIGLTFPAGLLHDPRVAFLIGFFFDALLGQILSLLPQKFQWLTRWIPESPAGEPDPAQTSTSTTQPVEDNTKAKGAGAP